jgi:RimJ/RimL family protein N-acetyltransferase
MFAVLSDPAIYEYENEPPASLDWLRERYGRLESRRSTDGQQQWLNWVLRLRAAELVGYVQATVFPSSVALVAYVLSSRYWGRGLAREACEAMLGELAGRYGVGRACAVFKRANTRSLHLLERLGFAPAAPKSYAECEVGSDELLMTRELGARA